MWWKTYFIFNERLDFNSERLVKSWFEDFHISSKRLDDMMKDLYFLQRKTWFQFRKTCKNLDLKASILSTKDLMMWWKTYIFFKKDLIPKLKDLQNFGLRTFISSTKDLMWWKTYFFLKKTWFQESLEIHFVSSTKDLMTWWKTGLKGTWKTSSFSSMKDLMKKDMFEENFKNLERLLFFYERLDDLMKDFTSKM